MKHIPLADPSIGRSEVIAVAKVLRSGWLTQGENVARFENALATLLGAEHVVAMANGTVTLENMLRALAIGPGDEVIVPASTFAATVSSVLTVGATAVLADIDNRYLCIRPESVDSLITGSTKAVIHVHYGGNPGNIWATLKHCRDYGVPLIEDAAQALGMTDNKRPVGSWGCMASLSFAVTKLLTTGEGGAVVTGSDDLAQRLCMLRDHGRRHGSALVQMIGTNARMTEIAAAIGLCQLQKYKKRLIQRIKCGRELDEAIKQTGVALPQQIPPQTRVPYSLYTVRFRDYKRRNCVQDRLKSMGFGVKLPFIPLHLMPALKAHPQVKVRFNLLNACELYDKGLVLPCNSLMERKHIDQIADTIKKYG